MLFKKLIKYNPTSVSSVGRLYGNEKKHILVTCDNENTKITIIFVCWTITRVINNDYKVYRLLKDQSVTTNNCPLMQISDTHFTEGFWSDKYDYYQFKNNSLPLPIETNIKVDFDFLKKLDKVFEKSKKTEMFGCSYCRICDKINGGTEYCIENNNVTFTVPCGIKHYYEDHNVQPSEKFYNFIQNYTL